MNAPGKGLLKVVSILYIVFGSLFALLMLLSLFLASVLAGFVGDMLGFLGAWATGLLFVVFLIPAAVDLVFGIIGVKSAGDPSKAMFFIVTGIVLTALTLFGVVSSQFSIWNLLPLVMPVLFIVGGALNRKAVVAPPMAPPTAPVQ